jgi:hypothetical protein
MVFLDITTSETFWKTDAQPEPLMKRINGTGSLDSVSER